MRKTSGNSGGSALCVHCKINRLSGYLKTFKTDVLPGVLWHGGVQVWQWVENPPGAPPRGWDLVPGSSCMVMQGAGAEPGWSWAL